MPPLTLDKTYCFGLPVTYELLMNAGTVAEKMALLFSGRAGVFSGPLWSNGSMGLTPYKRLGFGFRV